MEQFDIAIIGAGPAGMVAAIEASKANFSVVVFDEQTNPGGQIFRSIETTPVNDKTILGPDYWDGLNLAQEFRASNADARFQSSVWDINNDKVITYTQNNVTKTVQYKTLILATGAMERAVPFPGWELPGVMTVGAGQILLKNAGLIGKNLVLAGSGPLLDVLALQYTKAGYKPLAIVDMTPRKNYLKAIKYITGALIGWRYIVKGLKLKWDLKMMGVKRFSFCHNLSAQGNDKLSAISFSQGNKTTRLEVDHLMTHFGVIPNINLTRALDIKTYWDKDQLCHRPVLIDSFLSTRKDTYIVGDAVGIFGVKSAQINARIVISHIVKNQASLKKFTKLSKQDKAIRPFLEELFRPNLNDLLDIPDDTLICRCESVRLGEIKEAITVGAKSLNEIKTFTRCGMGPCQGRQCGNSTTLLTALSNQLPNEQVEYFKTRSPAIPVTFSDIADTE